VRSSVWSKRVVCLKEEYNWGWREASKQIGTSLLVLLGVWRDWKSFARY